MALPLRYSYSVRIASYLVEGPLQREMSQARSCTSIQLSLPRYIFCKLSNAFQPTNSTISLPIPHLRFQTSTSKKFLIKLARKWMKLLQVRDSPLAMQFTQPPYQITFQQPGDVSPCILFTEGYSCCHSSGSQVYLSYVVEDRILIC